MTGRIRALVRKEFRELRRDPTTLWIAAALPILMLFLFGYAISLDVDDVPMAVLDLDRSPASARLVEAFEHTGDFRVRRRPEREARARELLDRGEVRLALVIPRGFGRELERGGAARVQTLIDGSFSATAAIIRNEVEAVTAAFTGGWLRERAGGSPVPGAGRIESRVWYNPSLRSATFVIPGLFAVILMAFPPLLTVLAVVREKESGSIEQVYVSPLRAWEFIAGKMVPYVAVALLELLAVVAVGVWWFRIPFRGSLLLLASGLYVLCTVGLGLLVSTLTRSQVVAVLLAMVVTLMPSFLFSGFMFPISAMPPAIRWYTRLFPARYFTEVSRGLFLKGTGAAELGDELAVLAAYTLLVFAAASLRFRKKVA